MFRLFGFIFALLLTLSFSSVGFADGHEENLLSKTFEAHGGLDKWNQQKKLTYTMKGFPLTPQVAKPNTATIDLQNRYSRVESEGFVLGFNGTEDWVKPNLEAVGVPPRFFSMGSFYYVGMPFVFGDEGVVITDAGTGTYGGKEYKKLEIGYKTGTGYTSKDKYEVFIDKETNHIALLNNTVSEIPDVEIVTWSFNEWQTVDGLLVPAKLTFRPGWNPENPGDGAVVLIEDLKFSTEAVDSSIYNPPAGAVVIGAPQVH